MGKGKYWKSIKINSSKSRTSGILFTFLTQLIKALQSETKKPLAIPHNHYEKWEQQKKNKLIKIY